jgi:hypothetical protein
MEWLTRRGLKFDADFPYKGVIIPRRTTMLKGERKKRGGIRNPDRAKEEVRVSD